LAKPPAPAGASAPEPTDDPPADDPPADDVAADDDEGP
jgi:hypothetical protein